MGMRKKTNKKRALQSLKKTPKRKYTKNPTAIKVKEPGKTLSGNTTATTYVSDQPDQTVDGTIREGLNMLKMRMEGQEFAQIAMSNLRDIYKVNPYYRKMLNDFLPQTTEKLNCKEPRLEIKLAKIKEYLKTADAIVFNSIQNGVTTSGVVGGKGEHIEAMALDILNQTMNTMPMFRFKLSEFIRAKGL